MRRRQKCLKCERGTFFILSSWLYCVFFFVLFWIGWMDFLARSRNFRRKYIEIPYGDRKSAERLYIPITKKKCVFPIYFDSFGVWFSLSGLNCVLGRSSVFVFVWKVESDFFQPWYGTDRGSRCVGTLWLSSGRDVGGVLCIQCTYNRLLLSL